MWILFLFYSPHYNGGLVQKKEGKQVKGTVENSK